MTQGPNIQARLREGIDAAKQGDRLAARRLLQQVLAYDRNNELALMWMASVVDTLEERRSFLQRALQVNPNNSRAREALRRLGGDDSNLPPPTTPADTGAYVETPTRSSNNIYLLLAGAVGVILVVIVAVILLNPSRNSPTQPTLSSFQMTFSASMNITPEATNTPDPRPATATVFTGVVVTFDQNLAQQLPASFTPTPPPTATPTLFPSATPLALNDFSIVYSDVEPNAAAPSLYSGSADGTNEIKLESGTIGGFTDVAISPNGDRIAFVRLVPTGETLPPAPEGGAEATEPVVLAFPQLFVAPLDNLENAQMVTNYVGDALAHPAWSPDGRLVVFASDNDGDEDIYILDTESGEIRIVTQNTERDFDPSFSPDGDLIVFASDFETPGFAEIYTMTTNGGEITRLTDEAGSSYSPVFSPDGTRIAFISDRQGDADLYVMDANGQRPFMQTIDDNGADDRSPAWSPDSRWIVFSSNREDDTYFWYAIDPSGVITKLADNDRLPQSLTFIDQTS